MAKLGAHQEKMIISQKWMLHKLHSCLEMTEAWLGELKAMLLVETQEEVEVTVEQKEVR
jgi:hypothetical protein